MTEQEQIDILSKEGGMAFPCDRIFTSAGSVVNSAGMSMRDYFAAKALQGIIASEQSGDENFVTVESYARDAYRYADAMLEARK